MRSDVLLIYASKPSGHQNAAAAVSEALEDINPGLVVSELDFFTREYPILGPVIASLYLEIVQRIPDIWDYIYHNKKIEKSSREIRKYFNFIQLPKIKKYLNRHNPSIVVSTHAATTGIMAGMRENGAKFYLAGVITDFSSNNYWPNRGVDIYFTPTKDVKEELLARGVCKENIEVTGIPTRREFEVISKKEKALESLGLKKNIFTLLIMGGNHGLGSIDEVVKVLPKKSVQSIVVCGHNTPLKKKLIKGNYRKSSVKILGYAENISALMDASDLLVAKAGGITIAEAINKNLPIIIYNPLPAQEAKNTEYLLKNNAAIFCRNTSELLNQIKTLKLLPLKLAFYKKNMQSIMPLRGGAAIASILSDKLQKKTVISLKR